MISMIGFNFQCFQSKQNKVNFEQFPRFSLYLFSIKDSIKFLMDSNACTASNEKNIPVTWLFDVNMFDRSRQKKLRWIK